MRFFGNRPDQLEETEATSAPFLAMAFFCERIYEDESGLKTFVHAVDTLGFNLSRDEQLSNTVWNGKVAIEITFGDHTGPIDIEMVQTELATGQQETGLSHRIDTTDYPGKLAFSLSVDMQIAFRRPGNYRYEFFLNGVKRGETALRVREIRT